MSLVPLQLPDSGVDPRGRRYTAQEREHAYLTGGRCLEQRNRDWPKASVCAS